MKKSEKFVVGQKVYDPFDYPFEEGVVKDIERLSCGLVYSYLVEFNDSPTGRFKYYTHGNEDEDLFTYPCEVDSNGKVVKIKKFRQFELTSISMIHSEDFEKVTLYRIRATRDIKEHGVKKGDLGGWVEKEENMPGFNSWIADEAKVFGNAKIKQNALVSGNAKVFGDAIVEENAKVCDNAMVFHSAKVYGNAIISDTARVRHNAIVREDAKVYGDSLIDENALVEGSAEVFGKAWIFGNAEIHNSAKVFDCAHIKGQVNVYGDAKIYEDSRLSERCIVYDNAEIKGKAKLCGNVTVTDNAVIEGGFINANEIIGKDAYITGTSDVVYLSGFISDKDLTFYKTKEGKIMVVYGQDDYIPLKHLDSDKIATVFFTDKEILKSLKKIIKKKMNSPQLSEKEKFLIMFRQNHNLD